MHILIPTELLIYYSPRVSGTFWLVAENPVSTAILPFITELVVFLARLVCGVLVLSSPNFEFHS